MAHNDCCYKRIEIVVEVEEFDTSLLEEVIDLVPDFNDPQAEKIVFQSLSYSKFVTYSYNNAKFASWIVKQIFYSATDMVPSQGGNAELGNVDDVYNPDELSDLKGLPGKTNLLDIDVA